MTIDEPTATRATTSARVTATGNPFDHIRGRGSAENDSVDASAQQRELGPGQAGYSEYAFGRSALLDANALAQSSEGTVSAVLLYRAAALLFGKAQELQQTPEEASEVPPTRPRWLDWQPARALFEALTPERGERVERVLALRDGEAMLARLEGAHLREILVDLKRLALQLAHPLERGATRVRTRQALRRLQRALPWLIAVGVGSSIIWNLVVRTNIAAHSVVITTSAERKVRANPRALVDGNRKNLGFHTKQGRGEAVTIDLRSVQPIQSVEIYNRYDCCKARAVPLRLEASTDGVTYDTLARRTETFSFWKVSLTPKPVRFLRLTNESLNHFHLSEVEVY